jgi:hypothetical protein
VAKACALASKAYAKAHTIRIRYKPMKNMEISSTPLWKTLNIRPSCGAVVYDLGGYPNTILAPDLL